MFKQITQQGNDLFSYSNPQCQAQQFILFKAGNKRGTMPLFLLQGVCVCRSCKGLVPTFPSTADTSICADAPRLGEGSRTGRDRSEVFRQIVQRGHHPHHTRPTALTGHTQNLRVNV